MRLAVGRLYTADTSEELGTVFAVTAKLALTAFHCVGDRTKKKILESRVQCIWEIGRSNAVVEDFDAVNDVALLRLSRQISPDLQPIRLTRSTDVNQQFVAPGAPSVVKGIFTYAASGRVTWIDSLLTGEGAPAIQLSCRDSVAGLALKGLSGAPVLVGESKKAIGLIRWNPPRDDNPNLAAGASLYAAPSNAILTKWPELDDREEGNRETLLNTFTALLTRHAEQRRSIVADQLVQFILSCDIGIRQEDLISKYEGKSADRCCVEVETACVIFEVVDSLALDEAVRAGERRLSRYLSSRSRAKLQRYIGVLTDGTNWYTYHRVNDKLRRVFGATLTLDPMVAGPEQLRTWLEALLATEQHLTPTPREIVLKLGAHSPSYAMHSEELRGIYRKYRTLPTVKVKRDMWANLLTTAAGTNFTNNDDLFVDHTLLVVMAEIIGHAVIGFHPEDPKISAETIVAGTLFSQAQIGGVIEADFFDWIAHVPDGDRFVKGLAKRIARFAWGSVEHDVMKTLYESIIPQETRHQLGEYYTPDWLAEEILENCVLDPLHQRVLDASCGSGTFLFHAVRRYVNMASRAGISDTQIIREAGEHVIGFDVHPVAVTLARVTYLLAIGKDRLQRRDRPAFAIPVYLGDSLRWGRESTLWSQDGLSVPTRLDHQTFLNDPEFALQTEEAPNLDFPDAVVANADLFDRLVSELAELATSRTRHSPVPKLTATFRRFEIFDELERFTLTSTFKAMCKLHDDERDHIWGYYLRNLARPVWLARPENRVDVLIGNPPWLAYRYMTSIQKASFRGMSTQRGLWTGSSVATHQDLSALFVARSIEQYLRPGGIFGFVMPLGTLSRTQYSGFRSGRYSTSSDEVIVGFDQPWDLHGVKPAFFPQSVGVIFGRRLEEGSSPVGLTGAAEMWSGKFDTKTASRLDARTHIARAVSEATIHGSGSAYGRCFSQGAALVPRLLFVVSPGDAGPLGTGANRSAIRSKRSAFEKKPWKDLPSVSGTIEREFIRDLYLGDSLLPFRRLKTSQAVIPWVDGDLLDGEDERIDFYPGLAKWWRSAEAIWNRYRSSDQLSLIEQLDYRRKLTRQLATSRPRVIYNKSGMYLAAATVADPEAIIDQQLYWGEFDDEDEAKFLTAILNSSVLTAAVRPLQARGEHNPRHFDKAVFQASIPLYVSSNPTHRQLAGLADRAEQVAAEVPLERVRFEAMRRRVRAALIDDGVAQEIDAIVKSLLA